MAPARPPSLRGKNFVHTGPGTLAGRYMRTFWQPIYRAQDLPPGRSKPIRVMSEELTLYRGELSSRPLPVRAGGEADLTVRGGAPQRRQDP